MILVLGKINNQIRMMLNNYISQGKGMASVYLCLLDDTHHIKKTHFLLSGYLQIHPTKMHISGNGKCELEQFMALQGDGSLTKCNKVPKLKLLRNSQVW